MFLFRASTFQRSAVQRLVPAARTMRPAIMTICPDPITEFNSQTAFFTTKSGNAGRILTFQKDLKKSKGIKLCSGCGAQVVRGTEPGFKTGRKYS